MTRYITLFVAGLLIGVSASTNHLEKVLFEDLEVRIDAIDYISEVGDLAYCDFKKAENGEKFFQVLSAKDRGIYLIYHENNDNASSLCLTL